VVQCDKAAYRGDSRYRTPAVWTMVHTLTLLLTLAEGTINTA